MDRIIGDITMRRLSYLRKKRMEAERTLKEYRDNWIYIKAIRYDVTPGGGAHTEHNRILDKIEEEDRLQSVIDRIHMQEVEAYRCLDFSALTDEQMELLRMKYFKRMTYEEIADIICYSKSNVHYLLDKALSRIRSNDDPENFEPVQGSSVIEW